MTSQPPQKKQDKSQLSEYQKTMNRIIPFAFFPLIGTSFFIQMQVAKQSQYLCKYFYDTSVITNFSGKLTIIKQFMYAIAIYEFSIACLIMVIRILWYKTRPVQQQDPIPINLCNKFLNNTIEQTFIFSCLYLYILFSDLLINNMTVLMMLPIFFIIGRCLYLVGDSLGSLIGLAPLRALGFAFGITANIIMLETILFKTQNISSFFFV